MNPPDGTDDTARTPADWAELHEAELGILTQLCSPEACDAFGVIHRGVRAETAERFAALLRTINTLSGPGFADRASAELLEVVAETGEVELMARHHIDDPIGALALAQLMRTIADNRPVLGESFGL
ncbi:hypothetical protein [Rhodococcoides fascians]|uniref:hypothetical protein n=1 Tax=Rhodococcoides fascians TaxID=1828 RepID=UPI00055A1F38|nr:hypothetical protein [Rhodococcus fascians]